MYIMILARGGGGGGGGGWCFFKVTPLNCSNSIIYCRNTFEIIFTTVYINVL